MYDNFQKRTVKKKTGSNRQIRNRVTESFDRSFHSIRVRCTNSCSTKSGNVTSKTQQAIKMYQTISKEEHETMLCDYIFAAIHGNLDGVIQRIRKGIPIETRYSEGCTALHKASGYGHLEICTILNKRVECSH
jgi:hypothetical protein